MDRRRAVQPCDLTADPRIGGWLDALVATPGLTAVRTAEAARELHVDDALSAAAVINAGPVVDVGSGGGSPGLPLAATFSTLEFDLLEASRRKCAFLERWAAEFPNTRVICERAEIYGRGDGRDRYAVALARALAPPAVALEWVLPLVRPGGRAVLFLGSAPTDGLDAVAQRLGACTLPADDRPAGDRRLALFEKVGPTPPEFPRRPGVARRRPL